MQRKEVASASVLCQRPNPEEMAYKQELRSRAGAILRFMSPRHREILRRFYLLDQPADQIQNEMNLTYNQFRLYKSRAKAKFVEYWQATDRSKVPVEKSFLRAS